MIPTYLYIKQCDHCGLRYFGKTIQPNLEAYKGSGTRWMNHIKKHGKHHVQTMWSEQFKDESSLHEFALAFSEIFDIADSKEWANLMEETGIDGSGAKSLETRMKISQSRKGLVLGPQSAEHRANMSIAAKKRWEARRAEKTK